MAGRARARSTDNQAGDREEPVRTCLGCRQVRPRRALVRLVRDAGGTVRVDRTGSAAGRGAYSCPSAACIERALKGSRLTHAFRKPSHPAPTLVMDVRGVGCSMAEAGDEQGLQGDVGA